MATTTTAKNQKRLKQQFIIKFYIILLLLNEIYLFNYLYINIPITSIKLRKLLNLPIYIKNLKLLQFSNWLSDWSNELSWEYIKMANYELPLYIKEGYWIPESLM
ncbi:unnamed protein product [Schistosoma mattheei]|uniref:Uncharacterized protein n=1 Tax=Schistosoma mattheei TaxID=31246 RepID=A0A183NPQ7_9TREM|nr:unnamed protein product [Schistosoma mattheei]